MLKEAVVARLADAITYASPLDVIAKSQNPDVQLACRLLNEAIAAGLANAVTYSSTLDVIAKSHKPDVILGAKLLKEAEKAALLKFPFLTDNPIDLHGFSFGTVYFGLKEQLNNRMQQGNLKPINIIYGKGLHSKNFQVNHPLKQAVHKIAKEMGLECHEDKVNSGIVHISMPKRAATLSNRQNQQYLFHTQTSSGGLNTKTKPLIPDSSLGGLRKS